MSCENFKQNLTPCYLEFTCDVLIKNVNICGHFGDGSNTVSDNRQGVFPGTISCEEFSKND